MRFGALQISKRVRRVQYDGCCGTAERPPVLPERVEGNGSTTR